MKTDLSQKRPKPFRPPGANSNVIPQSLYALLLALVFFSGFAALVYELLWFRRLGLVFGNTVQAAATVLTAFMVGLAWGASRARKWVLTTRNPIRLFGLIEGGIGIYALAVPAVFVLLRICYQEAAHYTSGATSFLIGLRFVLGVLVLFVPTMLMGASLPVLAEAALHSRERFASKLGLLYGSNTAGATLGVLACGFFLVPRLGVNAANYVAAAINLVVGGTAIYAGRARGAVEVRRPEAALAGKGCRRLGYLAVAALCGGLALAFETVWFRALTLVLGSTTYSFAMMVACFLLGIALGAALLGRVADRLGRAGWALTISLAGIGLWTFLSMRLYNAAPDCFLRLLLRTNFTWNGMLLTKSLLSAIFLLPLATFSGMAFTAVVRLIRESVPSAGRAVGAAFCVNAIGSAAGSAIAGFAMVPVLGMERSLLVLGWVAVLIALAICWYATGAAQFRRMAFMGVLLGLAATLRLGAPPWDPLLLSSGPYFTPWANVRGDRVCLRERLQSVELLFYREGTTSTIDVKRTAEGRLYFSSGGKVEADSSPASMCLQRMQGHIPMLFHPHARQVLNIGLGAGVTAGAVTCYPDVQLEVVDIEPAVTNVAAIFGPRNHHAIWSSKFKLTVNDGHNHLLVTTNRYDVITSDPFEPVMAGAAALYTVDHFQLARSRLAPDGIMAQFLPLYELSPQDILCILRSFLRVFPRAALFFTGSDTILLGMTGQARISIDEVAAKMAIPEVRASLAEVGIDRPERLLDMLVIDFFPGRATLVDGPLNTDNHPWIEFSAPRSSLEYRPDANQKVLLGLFQDIPETYLTGFAPETVAEIQRGHAGLRAVLEASVLRAQGHMQAGLQLLRQAVQQAPANPILRNELSASLVLLAGQAKTPEEALALYEEAIRVHPRDFWALYNLVIRADASNQPAKADQYLRQGFEAYPDSALLLALRGKRAGMAGDVDAACRDFEAAIKKMPRAADFWDNYAFFLKKAGREKESTAAYARSKQLSK